MVALLICIIFANLIVDKINSDNKYMNKMNIKIEEIKKEAIKNKNELNELLQEKQKLINNLENKQNEQLKKLDDLNEQLNELSNLLSDRKLISDRTGLSMEVSNEIITQCKERNIPISLMLGLFDYESSFNPSCKNPSSTATGLGQFLHGTAKWIAEMEDMEFKVEYLKDPVYNVKLTAAYLEYLYKNRGNNWIKALKGYGDQTSSYPSIVISRGADYEDIERKVNDK